jgi:putative endopeptidase
MYDTSFLLNERNTGVKPGEDFFEYAVGGWLKNNPIPDDASRWSAFDQLREENYLKLKELFEIADSFLGGPHALNAKLVGTFYGLGMDTDTINRNKTEPVAALVGEIQKVGTTTDLVRIVGKLHARGIQPFFGFASTPDSRNSEWVIAALFQGGLGLPDREYYLSDDPKMIERRNKYKTFVENMFVLFGTPKPEAAQAAKDVLKIETKLAGASRTKVELRDPVKNYNKMDDARLKELSSWHWKEYFEMIGLTKRNEIDVGQPEFVAEIGRILTEVPLQELKTYVMWHLFLFSADFLSDNLVEEKFSFYGRYLQGQPKIRDRWKRTVMVIDDLVGQAVGKLYVEKYFPPSAKQRADELVKNVVLAMQDRINAASWMEGATKKQALEKLHAIKAKIGYPNWWVDYSGLKLDDTSYLGAVMSARKFEFERDLNKIGKPVNHEEWFIAPQVVNAFYNPLDNEIVFPAGILQPPFFYADADDALNYGGFGTVIGHEITHGFDDSGRQYDAKGNLRDWWTEKDAEQFKERSAKLVQQYANCLVEGEPVNGELTLGENIADLGGLIVGYLAFKKTGPQPSIDGLTPDQRFFLNHAHTSKSSIRKEKALLYLKIDPHSPDKYRVNVPLSNMPEFAKAFGLTDGPMVRSDRAEVW